MKTFRGRTREEGDGPVCFWCRHCESYGSGPYLCKKAIRRSKPDPIGGLSDIINGEYARCKRLNGDGNCKNFEEVQI